MAPAQFHENFSEHINCIRSILVKTLSSENVSQNDVLKVKRFDKTYGFNKSRTKDVAEKEARLRSLKERQNEERQKKLEEMRAQALAAQKFKEQKEFERRRRLEELRTKDDQRRQQVEDRKRAINEAERDRLESILRRNQEREARIVAKKRNERSSIVFAFGSSTPRMLDPTDVTVSFWGHRRATSTQNITTASSGSSLTRRQSERDLDVGSKKRATSAGGLERAGESLISPTTPAGCASGYIGRRRTDLVPTVPSRDSSFHSSTSRKSLNHSPASSRPSSSMSQQSTNSVTSSVNVKHRISTAPRRPRPASIAVTGVSHDRNSFDRGENKPPLPKTRKPLSKTNTSEKIEKGTLKTKAAKSPTEETVPKVAPEDKKEVPGEKDPEPPQQAVQPVQIEPEVIQNKEPTSPLQEVAENIETPAPIVTEEPSAIAHPEEKQSEQTETQAAPPSPSQKENAIQNFIDTERKAFEETAEVQQSEIQSTTSTTHTIVAIEKEENKESKQETSESVSSEMTTSVSKPRITTEEEAKAALAERRRLIREETERQAELERQRIEAAQQAEFERQQKEEEQARLLAQMQREAEEERLQEAIKEVLKREKEELLRREEEARQKLLKEEADKKAKEEAERQKAELQKKLENEEKEREERRRRVEMIMSRTRGKNNANNLTSQNSQDKTKPENKQAEDNKINEDNKVNENKLNGSQQENGTSDKTTKNGKDVGIVDNIIPDDSVKNANTTVTDTLNSDSINSNSAWQPTQQYDS